MTSPRQSDLFPRERQPPRAYEVCPGWPAGDGVYRYRVECLGITYERVSATPLIAALIGPEHGWGRRKSPAGRARLVRRPGEHECRRCQRRQDRRLSLHQAYRTPVGWRHRLERAALSSEIGTSSKSLDSHSGFRRFVRVKRNVTDTVTKSLTTQLTLAIHRVTIPFTMKHGVRQMMTITITAATQALLLAALDAHATDDAIGLKTRRRDEDPRIVAPVVAAWPADADGLFRIALSLRDLTIVWRAYSLNEIAAGRGLCNDADEYGAKLGLTENDLTPAYGYVADRLRGHGVRAVDGDRRNWTKLALWVRLDGNTRKPKDKYASTEWRSRARMHEACAAVGLAMPGRNTWDPRATTLFLTPREKLQAALALALSAVEDEAIEGLMAA